MAATVPIEKAGDVNELLESAKKIGEPPSDEEKEAAKQPVNEPAIGSFEKFMATIGNPSKWSGRS